MIWCLNNVKKHYWISLNIQLQRRRRGFSSGGHYVLGTAAQGSGRPDARKFSKICKIFLKKIEKRITSAYFSKILKTLRLIFSRLTKIQLVGKIFSENYFENCWWKFSRKIEFLVKNLKIENFLPNLSLPP